LKLNYDELLSNVALNCNLRHYITDKCEPPVYVSDRRLVKSIALLRVVGLCSLTLR